ncbi:hypothetical protein HY285_03400 [Candidatus Peregrinibacteria bacterium]|nr:hypothetical protein [Candidatus Peregrinibacteria bacterium]MBI3816561.1 hypothetical protein [Candidatus Peregrinibacteria bacterium]
MEEGAIIDVCFTEQESRIKKPDPIDVLVTRLSAIMIAQAREDDLANKDGQSLPPLQRDPCHYESLRHRLRIYKEGENHYLEFMFQLNGNKWRQVDLNVVTLDETCFFSMRYPGNLKEDEYRRFTEQLERALIGLGRFPRPRVLAEKEANQEVRIHEVRVKRAVGELLDRF